MSKAIFLDRDGTINVDKGYVYRIEDFEFIEKVPEAIAVMKQLGYQVIVLSNQSGVARGFFSEQEVNRLHRYINEKLEPYGGKVDKFYYCPHHPDGIVDTYRVECSCRKPKNEMLLRAVEEFEIDTEVSWVIGDRERDLFLQYGEPINRVLLTMEYEGKCCNRFNYQMRKSLWEFVQMDLIGNK